MLLNSIEEIKLYMPIGVGNDFNRLKPHIANAESKYISTLLGTAMYDELVRFYAQYLGSGEPLGSGSGDDSEQYAVLLQKVQRSLIHLAYFVGFDFLNIQATDAGFHRIEGQNKQGLYKYQEDNLKRYFSDSGFNGLDDVLLYLEDNKTIFTTFAGSGNYTILKTSLLPSVQTVENIPFNIYGSRLIFLALKPMIAYIEDTDIRVTLGTTVYDEIKTELAKAEPAAKVLAILPVIRKPLIYLASAMFMEESGADLTERGLWFEKTAPQAMSNTAKQPASEQRIAALIVRNRNIGNSYLEALKSYLLKNISVWGNYTQPEGNWLRRNNTDKKTFWA